MTVSLIPILLSRVDADSRISPLRHRNMLSLYRWFSLLLRWIKVSLYPLLFYPSRRYD